MAEHLQHLPPPTSHGASCEARRPTLRRVAEEAHGSAIERKPAPQTGEAAEVLVRGMYLGPVLDRDRGDLGIGHQIAASRSGRSQQIQHLKRMAHTGMEQARHPTLVP